MQHSKLNDKGQSVELKYPSTPTPLDSWADPSLIATATPGSDMPASIADIPVFRWSSAPSNADGWEALSKASDFDEPLFETMQGKTPASGAIVLEADGRVWVVSPSNKFGGYVHSFPKGKIESGEKLSLKANALKEVFEESGLKVELTSFLCDSERDTTTTRYYLAKRLGGNPADMCWESQAVHLVPRAHLSEYVAHKNDQPVIAALMRSKSALTKADIIKYQFGLASGHRILAAISGYRHQFRNWPNRILMDEGMAYAIKNEVLTPLGWEMLNSKVEVVPCDVRTVFAEGQEGKFEYGEHTHLTDEVRPDVWLWGIEIVGH